MACSEAPGLVVEKNRLQAIGAPFLGIIGDASHSFGYHLCNPPTGDYSRDGVANQPVGAYACALDVGMTGWAASRDWLRWLITEIREDRITGVAEVIGSFDGRNVRYWSDVETPQWQQEGVPYSGDGHDTWTHVAIYRSSALIDHKLLAGWTASGYQNGGAPVATGDEDFIPFGRPARAGGRNVGVMVADVWGGEMSGVTPYDGKSKSFRQLQLDRIEAFAKAAAEQQPVVFSPETIAALAAAVAEAVTQDASAEDIARELIAQLAPQAQG